MIQNREVEELARRGDGLDRFNLALQAARAKKDKAKGTYLSHVQEHGC